MLNIGENLPKLSITPLVVIVTNIFLLCLQVEAASPDSVEDNFVTDIEGIQAPMLHPEYWKQKLRPMQSVILSKERIEKQNRHFIQSNEHMNALEDISPIVSKSKVLSMISAISKAAKDNRYFANGSLVSQKDYDRYTRLLNLSEIRESVPVRFGMVIKRTNMRSFPTNDAVFKNKDRYNLDRFQETALFPTEAVAIYHESADGKWFFVSSYNYNAWVLKSDIAIGKPAQIFNYKKNPNFLMITGDKVLTNYNPINNAISEIQLDMGIRINLVKKENIPTSIDGQNTYTSYVINLPTRTASGLLKFQPAMIARSKDVHLGYLPFTQENLIEQSFKFLGERYGWGHSFNARDCTGFVGDVYKSFGILMPRNSGQQAQSSQGQNIHFSHSANASEKLKSINALNVGDLIYIPGHVMMFLGRKDGEPYIIHDVSGLSYMKKDGSYYKSTLNGVSVTPLTSLQTSQETSYLDQIYNLKSLNPKTIK